jgi:hypothetical protein
MKRTRYSGAAAAPGLEVADQSLGPPRRIHVPTGTMALTGEGGMEVLPGGITPPQAMGWVPAIFRESNCGSSAWRGPRGRRSC